MTTRIFFALAAGMILGHGVAFAQPDARDLVPAIYPVADLVIPISARIKSEDIETSEAELTDRILKNVAPESWDRAGGRGSIRFDSKGGYLLHVRQTPAVHVELQKFLATLPRGEVALEVRIVTLSDKFSEKFDIRGLAWKQNDGVDFALIDDLTCFRLLKGIEGDPAAHALTAPKVTLFDGQDAKVEIVDWLSYQTGADVEIKNGSPVVVGQIERFFTGVKTRYLPRISADRKHVTVQMEFLSKSLVSEPAVMPVTIPVPGGLDDAGVPIVKDVVKTMVQKPAFNEIKLAVAAKIPDQRTVVFLAGKMLTEERSNRPMPVISRIPYLNRVFRNASYGRSATTVLVLLTPRIMTEPETAHVERITDGFRREEDEFFPLILPKQKQ